MDQRTNQFAIIAATFTGNRGAEAMLLTTIEQLRHRFPTANIHVLSYAARDDRAWLEAHPIPRVFIHDATPKQIALQWCPRAIIAKILGNRSELKAEHGQNIPALLKVDALFDLAGVAFIDGREKFLPFNLLTLAPFLLNGVPVYKMSQAIGPITSFPNRICSKMILPFCKRVIARGKTTLEHLTAFGLQKNLRHAPDVSFLLRPSNAPVAPSSRPIDIGIMPSSVVARKRPDYEDLIVEVAEKLLAKGVSVSLIAHSWKDDTDKPFNNDLPLIKRIASRVTKGEVTLYGPGLDARELKEIVSHHKSIITSRFHGMIAALDTETPPIVLGWSHKYREVLQRFNLDHCALPTSSTTSDALSRKALEVLSRVEELSASLTEALPRTRREAQEQFDDILDELSSSEVTLRKAS
jgi:colanic acid/amylovoran biosynthesis protein